MKQRQESKTRLRKKAGKTNKPVLSRWLLALALSTVLAAGVIYLIHVRLHQSFQRGELGNNPVSTNQNYADSLDLRVAAKASYPSEALQEVKDLGVSDAIEQQIISFSVADDHLTEYGLLYEPSVPPPPAGYPVIILCHGYYNPDKYMTTTGYINDMDFYARQGFAVIKPDFRGQGLSIHAGKPDGAYYSMSYNTDVMSLISAVKRTKRLDSGDINLWGHSMGAYIALRAAVLSPDIKNLILLSGPVGSLKEMYLSYVPPSDIDNPVALKISQAVFQKYGTPAENPTFWSDASPINFVSRISAHVQIYVGQDDRVVPPKFSADLSSALAKAGKPHEYYSYADGSHSLANRLQNIWPNSLRALESGKES